MIIDEPKHYQKHATTRNPYIVLFGLVTVAGEILPNFKCGYVYGTSKDDNIQIAKDVIANTTKDCSFSVIHKYAGERHVYGYIYGGKTYGSLTIQKYQGQSIVVDINNSEYTIRS